MSGPTLNVKLNAALQTLYASRGLFGVLSPGATLTNLGGITLNALGTVLTDSLAYYGTEQPFINLMKCAGQAAGNYLGTGWLTSTSVGGSDTNEGTALNFDSNGYPIQLPQSGLTSTMAYCYVCWGIPTATGAALAYPSGVYRLQFTGTGTIVIDGADASAGSGTGTNGLTFTNAGTGTVTGTFTASGLCSGGGGFRLTISSSNPSNNGNQVRAISIVQNSLATSFDGGAIFHPNFLASCTGYSTYRFKDWLQTDHGEFMNNSGTCGNGLTALTLSTSWKEATGTYPILLPTGQLMNASFTRNSTAVTLSTGASAAISGAVYPVTFRRSWASRALPSWCFYATGYGVPHEICIALANQLSAHAWVNPPLTMSDADHTSMATLYHTTLNSGLKNYPELSNETWNSGFPQYVASAYLGNGVFTSGLGSQNDYQLNYKGYRTAVMAEIWKTAWGTDFTRCYPIYGASMGNTYSATEGLNTPFWTGTIDGYTGPASSHPIKCLAIAPYFPSFSSNPMPSVADANTMLSQSDGGLNYFFQALYSNVITGGSAPGTMASIPSNGFVGQILHGGSGLAGIDAYVTLMATYPSLKLIGYEGGNQFAGNDPSGTTAGLYTWTVLCNTANRDSRMATAYATILAYWAANVGATQDNIWCLFNHCDSYGNFSWGALESVMQLANSYTPQRYLAEHNYIGA